jgi:catechol 2,3-dioxygenase-like lactoylglutathione lyase family enzyme
MTATAIHHVGIPVTSIDRSLPWYRDVLGLIDAGITGAGGGEAISAAVQVEGADMRFAFLTVGGVKLELLEYHTPKGKPFTSANNDIGTVHVCFEVDDIDETYRALTSQGVVFNAPPVHLGEENGPLAGHAFAYFRDPDNIQLELFELPKATS